MTIERLLQVLPPPTHPYNRGVPDAWPAIEAALGFTLPIDYKAYIDTYGTGTIARFLNVLNPFVVNPWNNLLQGGAKALAPFRIIRERDPDECPYPLYPEAEGLYPWGSTDEEQTLFWYQVGPADAWPIVVSDQSAFWRYEQTMTQLLVAWLSWEQIYEPFPVWYLDRTQFPDEQGNAPSLRLPDRPRTPDEARALFWPYADIIGDRSGDE